jgi:hypothetical protein
MQFLFGRNQTSIASGGQAGVWILRFAEMERDGEIVFAAS